MVSREHKRAILQEKLQLLRSVTNSHAQFNYSPSRWLSEEAETTFSARVDHQIKVSKTSIIVDASRYIQELQQKVEQLNQDVACVRSIAYDDPLPMVTVEALKKGFLINVFSKKSCPGLLVAVLEAFEELGLSVVEARVSCADSFRLEAVGGESGVQAESVDAQVVRRAVLQAIENCKESSRQE